MCPKRLDPRERRVKSPRRVEKRALTRDEALRVLNELWLSVRHGVGTETPKVVQEGLRALARGYDHSREMLELMGNVRNAMSRYSSAKHRPHGDPEVIRERARAAILRLRQHVWRAWPTDAADGVIESGNPDWDVPVVDREKARRKRLA